MDLNYTRATDGEEGLTLLRQVKVFRPDLPCILMTAWGTILSTSTDAEELEPLIRKALNIE
jgi:DNA-binding NtrC family response regulator